MMKKTLAFLLGAVLCGAVHAGGSADRSVMSPLVLEYRSKIFEASRAEDKARLEALHGELAELSLDQARNDRGAILYGLGLSTIALVELSFGDDSIPVIDLINEGQGALEQSVRMLPDYSDAHRALASLYSLIIPIKGGMAGANYGGKINSLLKKALRLDPDNALAHIEVAVNYYYTPEAWGGDLSKAEQSIRKAMDLDPDNPSVYVYLGLILSEQGRNPEGIEVMEQGLEKFPGHGELTRNLGDLKKKKVGKASTPTKAESQGGAAPEGSRAPYSLSLQFSLIQPLVNNQDRELAINPALVFYSPQLLGVQDLECLFTFNVFYSQLTLTQHALCGTPSYLGLNVNGYYKVGGISEYDSSFNLLSSYDQSSVQGDAVYGLEYLDGRLRVGAYAEYQGFINSNPKGLSLPSEEWTHSFLYGVSGSFGTAEYYGLDTDKGIFAQLGLKLSDSRAGGLGNQIIGNGMLSWNTVPAQPLKMKAKAWAAFSEDNGDLWALENRTMVGGGFMKLVSPDACIVRGWAPEQFIPRHTAGFNLDGEYECARVAGGVLSVSAGADACVMALDGGDTRFIAGFGPAVKWTADKNTFQVFSDTAVDADAGSVAASDIGLVFKRMF